MDYFETLLQKYRDKGALIDSNLLLLYFVGQYDRNRITTFKRTKVYTPTDFDLLADIINYFKCIVTTPNILTEVSNLAGQLPGALKPDCYDEFAKQVCVLEEEYRASEKVCKKSFFRKYGLTDSVIVDLSKNKYLVFTDDLPLFGFLSKKKIDVINFNHMRTRTW